MHPQPTPVLRVPGYTYSSVVPDMHLLHNGQTILFLLDVIKAKEGFLEVKNI